MSKKDDFLSGFSGGNTQKPLTEQAKTPVKKSKEADVKKAGLKPDLSANKKLADQIVAKSEKKDSGAEPVFGKATRPAQNASAIIKAPEHVMTKDTKFHKRKIIQSGMIGIVSLAVIIGIIFIVRMTRSIEVPDFSGWEFSGPGDTVQTWGLMNGITFNSTTEYSLEFAEGEVIRQDAELGSNIQRGSVLSVVVSDGPDMNEVIELPDFEEMTRVQITTWRNENGFTASSIAFRDEASSEVELNHVIDIEIPNNVDVNHFTRSDRLTIVLSTGPATVEMPNFMGQQGNTRESVETWIAANPSVDVEIVDEPSANVDRDVVIGQSHAPNANVASEEVVVRISVGEPVTVPNFADIPSTEWDTVAEEVGLEITQRTRLSAIVLFGRFVSQSIEAGADWFEGDPAVVVTSSAGRPWMPRFSTEDEIEKRIFEEFTSQGAPGITYEVIRVNSHEGTRGDVVHQSLYNQYVALDAHVVFHIGLGNLTPPEPPHAPQAPDNGGGADLAPDEGDGIDSG